MASLERTIERQRSRMRWIREGDANTKLFQAFANGRRAKKFISRVKIGMKCTWSKVRRRRRPRPRLRLYLGQIRPETSHSIWIYLDVQPIDLAELEAIFTEQEVLDAINELHPDRAPGPDGFIGAFY
jgi:hypothetical protein